jgi:UDP:flavonoid glycosyltransferase YjiC (YdhE family)
MLAALGDLDADVAVTVGHRLDPASLGAVAGNVRIEQYVPQRHLLDRVEVVVSHAGAGTAFAAAARGIPQLFLPLAADQWDNADALTAAGVGLTLEPDDRDRASILHAIVRLLGRSSRAAAETLSREFAELPHPREHVSTIEALV